MLKRKKTYVLLFIALIAVYYLVSLNGLNRDIRKYQTMRKDVIIDASSGEKLSAYYMYNAQMNYTFDDEGFPLYYVQGKGYIHPTQIVQIGLEKLSRYQKGGDRQLLDDSIRYADYLIERIRILEHEGMKYGVVPILFKNDHYPFLDDDWISGLLQGQTLSFLLRVGQETDTDKYYEYAELIFNSYEVPLASGGFKYENVDDLFYEEVVANPPTHILNGNIFSLLGLYDHWRVYRDEYSLSHFRKGVETVVRMLPKFSIGKWSYYDDPANAWAGISHAGYQNLHPYLLDILYNLTKDETLKTYSELWKEGVDSEVSKFIYLTVRNYYRAERLFRKDSFVEINY